MAQIENSNHPAFIYEIFTQSFADSNRDGIGDLSDHPCLTSGVLTEVRAIGTQALSFIRKDAVSNESCRVALIRNPRKTHSSPAD